MGEISFTSKTNVFLFETTQREGLEAGSGGDNEADRVSFFFFVIVFVVVGVSTVVPCARWESIKRRCVPKERVPVLLLLSAAGDGVNKCAFPSQETWLSNSNFS
jgi:hypothetical protein